jgi:hypothetical protein
MNKSLVLTLTIISIIPVIAFGAEDMTIKEITGVTQVCQLTGTGSYNSTELVHISGTDLGSMFEFNNRIYFLFGDTFYPSFGSGWRSNSMAYTSDFKAANGIKFDGWITDNSGFAKELIASKKIDTDEITVIPTYGIAVNNRIYIYFMSVKHWGVPGQWECNYSSIAYSDDSGQTFTKATATINWDSTSNFIQVALAQIDSNSIPGTKDILIWGIPSGRFGQVKLAKVNETQILDKSAYRYLSGIA